MVQDTPVKLNSNLSSEKLCYNCLENRRLKISHSLILFQKENYSVEENTLPRSTFPTTICSCKHLQVGHLVDFQHIPPCLERWIQFNVFPWNVSCIDKHAFQKLLIASPRVILLHKCALTVFVAIHQDSFRRREIHYRPLLVEGCCHIKFLLQI